MLRTILISVLTSFSIICFGQLIQEVDVVPYAADCDIEETLEQAVQCSEGMLLGYFLRSIDTLACPPSDTSRKVSVVMNVDKSGNYTAKVRANKMRPSCLSYFEEKGFKMPYDVEMFPALLNKKDVAFTKHLSFYYPRLFDGVVVRDSVTGAVSTQEELPRFRGCEEMLGGAEDKNQCSQVKLLDFIYQNLQYPKEAREKGIQGMTVVQFVVDENGYVTDPKIVREIGGGCGTASLNVIEKMNDSNGPYFVPGKLNGKAVKVMYTLPFRFKLAN